MAQSYLSTLDYIVFATVLVISAAIGVYYRFTGDRQRNVQVITDMTLNRQISLF